MPIGKLHLEHRPGQNHHHLPLNFNRGAFFRHGSERRKEEGGRRKPQALVMSFVEDAVSKR